MHVNGVQVTYNSHITSAAVILIMFIARKQRKRDTNPIGIWIHFRWSIVNINSKWPIFNIEMNLEEHNNNNQTHHLRAIYKANIVVDRKYLDWIITFLHTIRSTHNVLYVRNNIALSLRFGFHDFWIQFCVFVCL